MAIYIYIAVVLVDGRRGEKGVFGCVTVTGMMWRGKERNYIAEYGAGREVVVYCSSRCMRVTILIRGGGGGGDGGRMRDVFSARLENL